jgi:PhnB protein
MGFMPYIHFDGTCAEAMGFYARVFGADDLQMMRYAEAPGATGPDTGRIMHSQFSAQGGVLMASDFPPGHGQPQQAMSVMIDPAGVAEAEALFDRLAEGAAIIMPFGPTFWSPGFGMLKDRFGTHWIIGARPAEGPAEGH